LAEFKTTGRQEAFEEIVRRYAAMVFGVCLKTTRNAHDAEDATQAVFLTLAVQCKNRHAAREISYVGPWLQKVARRTSLDIRRSKKRRTLREETHAASNGHANGNGNGTYTDNGASGAGIDVEELKVVLNEELNQLPAKYRLPMILHYYGGLTREQIAQELGCKPSTLGVRIHRGRQMLAKRLTERGASPIEMGMSLTAGLTLAVRSAVSDGMVASTSKAAAKLMAGEELGAMISSHVLNVAHGAIGTALVAKLKLVAAVVVIALMTVAAGAKAKIISLDQLKLTWPIRLDGLFKLPSLRSPFRAPQANAGGTPDGISRHALASATRSAATDAAIQTVLWLADDEGPFGARPKARRPRGPGLGPAGRALVQVVSSVVSARIQTAAGATGQNAPPAAAPVPAPAAPQARDTAVAMNTPRGPVPAAAISRGPGSFAVDGGGALRMSGSVQFSDGGTVPSFPRTTPGGTGSAQVSPAPTAVAVAGPVMTVGGPSGSFGEVTQNGGRFEAGAEIIGGRGHGVFRQHGGQNIAETVALGVEPGSLGEYFLDGGELIFKPAPRGSRAGKGGAAGGDTYQTTGLLVGDKGTGVFHLGDEDSTGSVNTRWTSPGSSLVVRGDPSGVGVFHGWGRVSMGGIFDHSGQAIADGFGRDRALEFSGFRYLANSIENPTTGGTAGWFARDHGKLVLPEFRVGAGTGTYTWGEDAADPALDLVTSVRLTLHDVAAPGRLQVSLLSKDNGEVPTLPTGHTFIGVWKFDAGQLEYGDVDLAIRYDDGLAHELKLNENVLKVWRYTDGQWVRIKDQTFWRDVDQNLIGATAPAGGLQFFAVSAPEPAAFALVGLAAAAGLLRRPRRGRAGGTAA
jgi:RNA polymerase sigma factor (sigma-70 family)